MGADPWGPICWGMCVSAHSWGPIHGGYGGRSVEADSLNNSIGVDHWDQILRSRSVVDLETDLGGQFLGEPIHGGRSDEECRWGADPWGPIHGGRSERAIHGDPSMETNPKEPMHGGQYRGADPWWSI